MQSRGERLKLAGGGKVPGTCVHPIICASAAVKERDYQGLLQSVQPVQPEA